MAIPKRLKPIEHIKVRKISSKDVQLLISTGAPNNYILGIKPNSIGKNFDTLKKKLGIDIRFHDLRYYFASLAVVLNVPDTYTASLGG